MSRSVSERPIRRISVLLLKTRSTPHDTYHEQFSAGDFTPYFVPVLTHKQDEVALRELEELLRTAQLKEKYGGMIFTSQRAVEAWQDVVAKVEDSPDAPPPTTRLCTAQNSVEEMHHDSSSTFASLTQFPLYVVGPATSLALQSLHQESSVKMPSRAVFARLNPIIIGEHSGNGQSLAKFILQHYNKFQHFLYFTYFEAPRLPFIPLLGMGGENYSRSRMEADDNRLRKKPLLFLVGEQRRDVIPRTLMVEAEEKDRIVVQEMEVYSTQVLQSFQVQFDELCGQLDREAKSEEEDVRIVVVFSPQGTDVMLKSIGYLDSEGKPVPHNERQPQGRRKWVIATIGPTTRDFMKDKLGIEADICAARPSPEGLRKGIENYLHEELDHQVLA